MTWWIRSRREAGHADIKPRPLVAGRRPRSLEHHRVPLVASAPREPGRAPMRRWASMHAVRPPPMPRDQRSRLYGCSGPAYHVTMMLDTALKEWAVVCDLLLAGELAMLLRKGGILEAAGPDGFELETPHFALFPAWMHQDPAKLKPAYRDRVERFGSEPETVTIRGHARATHVWEVVSRAAFDELDELHPWSAEQIDMRFNYKPNRPLYLIAVRVHELPQARTIENDAEYAGCRSWVPLKAGDEIAPEGGPVLDDEAYGRIISRLDTAMGGASGQ